MLFAPLRFPHRNSLRSALISAIIVAGASGSIRGAERASDEPPVQMERFVVEETVKSATPWLYVTLPGIELLSHADKRITERFVQRYLRQLQLFSHALPWITPGPNAAPIMVILYAPTDIQKPVNTGPNAGKISFSSAMATGDSIFFFIDSARFGGGDLLKIAHSDRSNVLLGSYSGSQLLLATPRLPTWLRTGLTHIGVAASFTSENELVLSNTDPRGNSVSSGKLIVNPGGPSLDPFADHPLLPLEELFREPTSRSSSSSISFAQSGLFVRWALVGGGLKSLQAFEEFVQRATNEPMTEALFKEFFGLSYAEAQTALDHYLNSEPDANHPKSHGLTLKLPTPPEPLSLALREATPLEIARIAGEAYHRLSNPPANTHFKETKEFYLNKEHLLLTRRYDAGERDPRLLASLGLSELEHGDRAKARSYLEAAVAAKVLRPHAYLELARLRRSELAAAPTGADGHLDAAQVASILAPLDTVRTQQPVWPETYGLIVDVLAAGDSAPTAAQRDALREGIKLFPRDSRLTTKTAQLLLRHGFTNEAREVIAHGLRFAPDNDAHSSFEKLQAALPVEK